MGQSKVALVRTWALAYRVVGIPAALTAFIWAVTLSILGNVDTAADWAVVIAFAVLYFSTACAAACITALTIARLEHGANWWTIVHRRAAPTLLAFVILAVIGGAMAYGLRSYFAAWFVCSFFFMYVVPIVVGRNVNWLGNFYDSARLAIRQPGATFVSAAIIEAIGVTALAAAYLVSGVPYVGVFLQSLVVQFAFGFLAVLTLQQLVVITERQTPNATIRIQNLSSHLSTR
jgi:hypothetical protein